MIKGQGLLERILAVSSRYIRVVISLVDGELVDLSRVELRRYCNITPFKRFIVHLPPPAPMISIRTHQVPPSC